MDINKIIGIIRNLKEDAMAAAQPIVLVAEILPVYHQTNHLFIRRKRDHQFLLEEKCLVQESVGERDYNVLRFKSCSIRNEVRYL